jgi:hypothetical protein
MWLAGLTSFSLVVTGGLAWAIRRFRIATRDAVDLVAKLAVPRPVYAADWPELRIDALVCDPHAPARALVVARWPAKPEPSALLLIEIDLPSDRAKETLARWRSDAVSISPRWLPEGRMMMRRRRSNECVNVRLVRQTIHT